jgi:hypothetical protein
VASEIGQRKTLLVRVPLHGAIDDTSPLTRA